MSGRNVDEVSHPRWSPDQVAAHVARDLPPGSYVNVGIGLPTLVPRQLSPLDAVIIHSENGLLGLGPPPLPGRADPELIDAGKHPATLVPGGCYVSHVEAFSMIRGGHIDISIMGAFEVSQSGDLANWAAPGDMIPAVGGAMDLAVGARRVFAMMTHTTRDGRPKLVQRCTYPLTAAAVVERVYTDVMTVEVHRDRFVVIEAVEGVERATLTRLTGGALDFGPTETRVSPDNRALPDKTPLSPSRESIQLTRRQ